MHQPQRMVQQGAGVGAPCPALSWAFPVARRCLGSPDPLTSAWSWGGPGSLVLPWKRREKIGLVVVETLMEPGKEGGRRLLLLSGVLLASSGAAMSSVIRTARFENGKCYNTVKGLTWKTSKQTGICISQEKPLLLETPTCFNALEFFLLPPVIIASLCAELAKSSFSPRTSFFR